MSTFRIFGFSLLMTVVALVTGYLHGGPTALFLLAVLALLEVSLSFDNAIINAAILQRMSPFWQRMFLTIGILIAVFGMRLVFPLAIIWTTAGLDPSAQWSWRFVHRPMARWNLRTDRPAMKN